ncbi:MAG TPA: class I SAM-dependent methyltransferase [Sporichthya sp.]|nr:class I SAM-dependent methyltransferase [Sporichthya sp.]
MSAHLPTARVKTGARKVARKVPPLRTLLNERDRWRTRVNDAEAKAEKLRAERNAATAELKSTRKLLADSDRERPMGTVREAFPAGHYYSPIPDLDELRGREGEVFDRSRAGLPGIDVHAEEQLALLPEFASYVAECPFTEQPLDGRRYGFDNRFFAYGDGLALYCWLRHRKPRRLIEVGSGWSSALTLDVNDLFLGGELECTFIEPYPERLNSLLRESDRTRAHVIVKPLHSVGGDVFESLGPGDVLFIDSTHVSRVGSDVNRLLLDVVPSLPSGVLVHIHDVFWPFEYPADWVFAGRAWNEDYLLRALLIGNDRLRIRWFNDYLHHHHADAVTAAMPLWARNPGGSIYLEVM